MYSVLIVLIVQLIYANADRSCLNRPCECCRSGVCTVSGVNECSGCMDGYTGANCFSLCPENCFNCSQTFHESDRTCNICKQGYYNGRYQDINDLILRNDCSLACKEGCMACTSHNNCSICSNGYYMSSGNECKDCPRNCENCSSSLDCFQCRKGHFWNNGYCQRCELNCDTCTSQTHCTECSVGFKLKEQRCEKCVEGCLTCNGSDNCTRCEKGYLLDGTKCLECKDNCLDCTTNLKSEYTCKACQDGYYVLKNNCMKCVTGCLSCSSEENCQKCDEEYKLYYGSCQKCPSACIKCSSDFKCTDCENRHYLSNGFCYECPEYCISCLSKDTCTSCLLGHFGKTCSLTCPESCYNNQCNNKTMKCIACKEGLFLDDIGHCTKCPEHCTVCKSRESCIACAEGYKGETCNEKCLNCKAGTRCDKSNGYCFDGCSNGLSGQNCDIKCDPKCFACERGNPNKCTSCLIENVSAPCSSECPKNCLSGKCNDDDGYCTDGCAIGFWGSKCQQHCSDRCRDKECDQNNGKCTHGCLRGFTGDTCVCPSRCNCDERGQCESCKEGYGILCDKSCSEGCVGNLCFRFTGECLKGCEEGYNGTHCSKVLDQNSSWKNTSASMSGSAVAGMIIGFAVLVIIFVAGAVFVRRRKVRHHRLIESRWFKNRFEENVDMDSDLEEFSMDDYLTPLYITPLSTDEVDQYYNTIQKKKILLHDLAEYVENKTSADFMVEFQQLPQGFLKSYKESQREENVLKNRYLGIYPYDETRVILKDGPSDYINASFINGYNKRRAYIASLGPSVKYMGDNSTFWRMIWQEKCGKIVMLNKLQEGKVSKCDQYWPESDYSGLYNDITVSPLGEQCFPHYVVRTFEIQLKREKRNVTQLQFTNWPEKGKVGDATSFVDFCQKVNDVKTQLDGPTVVHCSSGVGRTGTYIALDILTKEGEAEGSVDIFSCVRNLREQRVKMVQSLQQYEYLHHALVRSMTFYTQLGGPSSSAKDNRVYESCKD